MWQTPPDLFNLLHSIFQFTVDAAASKSNALLPTLLDLGAGCLASGLVTGDSLLQPSVQQHRSLLGQGTHGKKGPCAGATKLLTGAFIGQSADYIIIPKGKMNFFTGKSHKVN